MLIKPLVANREHCLGGKGPFRAFNNAHSLTGISLFQGFLSSLIKFDKFGVSIPVSRAMHREKFDYLLAPYEKSHKLRPQLLWPHIKLVLSDIGQVGAHLVKLLVTTNERYAFHLR